jgi:hypothetical protein
VAAGEAHDIVVAHYSPKCWIWQSKLICLAPDELNLVVYLRDHPAGLDLTSEVWFSASSS